MDYQPYPEYRESGIEWLGKVPDHWIFYRLRFTAKINPLKSEVSNLLSDTLVSFVPMEAVGEYGGIQLTKVKPIESVYDGYTFFKDNDLLIAKITPCFENGKGAIATALESGIGFGTTELHVIRADQGFSIKFLFYLSISQPFRKIGESTMFGAGGQKRISEGFIKDFRIFFPSYEEQQIIAQFLDHKTQQIDQLIAKKQTLIGKLNEQRIALITHAVTKGLNPDVKMKKSGVEWLGDVPEHWEVQRLKFTSDIIDCKNRTPEYFDDGEYLVVRTTNVRNQKLVTNGAFYTNEENFIEWTRRGIPPEGSILFTREAPAGEICRVPHNIPLCLGQRMMNFIPFNKKYADFLFAFLASANLANFIASESMGSTVTHLRVEQIYNIPVAIPSEIEQTQIVEYLDEKTARIDRMVELNRQTIDKLKEYRTALITAAVTGKIDLRQWQETKEII
jgi:type I restriction enzyme S subunit